MAEFKNIFVAQGHTYSTVLRWDDADRYDTKQAGIALGHFEAEFGTNISATDEQYEFENYDDIKVGDVIECFDVEEVKPTL